MLDSHCHVDLASDPIGLARRYESEFEACVAVTMLPSHYDQARRHLRPFRHVMPAVGLHPLRATEAHRELGAFTRAARAAKFIGEIGLDASPDGKSTYALQKRLFTQAVSVISSGSFVTLHSRGAWEETLDLLGKAGVGPVCFHYFTGGQDGLASVIRAGHYVSLNSRMIEWGSRHRSTLQLCPRDRLLVESDAPFIGAGDPLKEVGLVYEFLADSWGIPSSSVEETIRANFRNCRTQ